jgi:hypothetical protein
MDPQTLNRDALLDDPRFWCLLYEQWLQANVGDQEGCRSTLRKLFPLLPFCSSIRVQGSRHAAGPARR